MRKTLTDIVNVIFYFLCGSCIGWLVGISLSEVTPSVVSVLLGLITTGTLFYSRPQLSLTTIKIVMLSLSIVLFSSIGMMARTNSNLQIMGLSEIKPPIRFIEKNTNSGGTKSSGSSPSTSNNLTGLHNAFSHDCEELRHVTDANLEVRLQQSTDSIWRTVFKIPKELQREVIEAICKK